MSMQEARILLPCGHDNAQQRLEADLVASFGGFTRTTGHGAWQSPAGEIISEPVNVYDVAMADDPASRSTLRSFARITAQLADQQCVYIRHAAGDVEFIEPQLQVIAA